jgi:hypothetical protein
MAELELEQLEGNLIPLELHEQRVEGSPVDSRRSVRASIASSPVCSVRHRRSTQRVVDEISDALLASLRAVADDLETEPVIHEPDVDRSA